MFLHGESAKGGHMGENNVVRNYKDTVFRMLCRDKGRLLEIL